MRPVQEKRFNYKGYPCVVFFQPLGFRTGYVGIPDTMKINEDEIECHGGVTYFNSSLYFQEDENTNWIGFDCGHCFDGFDERKALEYFENDEMFMKQYYFSNKEYWEICNEENAFRTVEYCEEECKKIVEQILKEPNKAESEE